jgi:hypothetical protein
MNKEETLKDTKDLFDQLKEINKIYNEIMTQISINLTLLKNIKE